ncbi:MAG: DUF4124 domain-containing protein [Zetaproteobacteria bacterium]|nr:MAG: DUF4124 domain-containing protein [Zetaproteobacteria bacterium]
MALLGVCALAAAAWAGEIYQWRDAQGVVHFTDDPSRIPPEAEPRRAHPERVIVMERKGGEAAPGMALFAQKCGACHVLFADEDPNKEPLADALRDPNANVSYSEKEIFAKIRAAARGEIEGSDMEPVEISDEELRAIARALAERLR